jgi:aspartyl-tRNA(Asn)/glutamyl-tRNA(Gln) amidotransferase subunit A
MNAPIAKSVVNHLSLVEVADAIARGEVTSVNVVEAALRAFEERDKPTNSVIWIQRERALEEAAALDKLRVAGRTLGPLHGVPLAHKDMYYQAGRPCTCGSKIRKDFVPSYTSTAVARLEGAGSITIAGLNMAEFAQNPTGYNAHYGDCHNPWGLAYCTGGSSSGSGVSVAARFIYGALGSDTGGSIRLPAAICGVTGIKGTQSRVSRYGAMPLSFSCDNVGPLARTARDCARLMKVIAGHDPLDITSSKEPVPDYEAALDGDIRGLRIGVPTNYFFDNIDPEVAAAFEAALEAFKARGATVARIEIPHMDAIAAYTSVVSRVEGGAIHAQWMRQYPQDYSIHLSARLYGSYGIPAAYYVEALSRRGALLKAVAKDFFGKADVMMTPVLRTKVPTLAATDIDAGGPGAIDRFMEVSYGTRPINYLGLPAVSVPGGFDTDGLPIGFQIIGRPFAEARILKAADAYQRETDWHLRRPPVCA